MTDHSTEPREPGADASSNRPDQSRASSNQHNVSVSLLESGHETSNRLLGIRNWPCRGACSIHEPHNDETPGRITSGREFRETETGSSGNYPRVAGQRKSLTCGDVSHLAELARRRNLSWHITRAGQASDLVRRELGPEAALSARHRRGG